MDIDWETPQHFFEILHREFCFTLDVCAADYNAKLPNFISQEENSLSKEWSGTCWMNPPYGRGQDVYSWVKKAYETSLKGGTVVCLLPASTDTRWFHDFAMKASEIRFIKDRLWFSRNGTAQRANHASIIVVFRPDYSGTGPSISHIPNCRQRGLSYQADSQGNLI